MADNTFGITKSATFNGSPCHLGLAMHLVKSKSNQFEDEKTEEAKEDYQEKVIYKDEELC